jgi:hypothetical protein
VKRWYYIVLGGILILGAVYIYMHRQDLGLVSPNPDYSASQADATTAPTPASISWTSVDRSPDGFTVEMPTGTKEITVPAYGEKGGADQVEMIYSYPDSTTSFSIAWADEPPVMRASGQNIQKTLASARDGALSRTQTVLVSEVENTRDGLTIHDFAGRNQSGGIFNGRLILTGRRLYFLMAAFNGSSARRESDVVHFFDSFKLVGAKAK